MVDLGGYVIILVETKDKRVKLYGSPADKAELEVADEILEINAKTLHNCSHAEVINHIHNCIKSRTICLRVKRRTGNKLAEELAEHNNVQDAFVIAVEQQARERLEKLSALRKIKPVDMTALSQELCDDKAGGTKTPIYSAPVSEIGSTHSVKAVVESEGKSERSLNSQLTEEELELNQRINRSRDPSANPTTARSRDPSANQSAVKSRDSSAHKPSTCRSRDPSTSKSCNRSRDSSASKPTCSRESLPGGSGQHVGRPRKCSAAADSAAKGSAAAAIRIAGSIGHSRNSSRDSLASCKSRDAAGASGVNVSRSCSRACDRSQVGTGRSSRQSVCAADQTANSYCELKVTSLDGGAANSGESSNHSKRCAAEKTCDRNQICDNLAQASISKSQSRIDNIDNSSTQDKVKAGDSQPLEDIQDSKQLDTKHSDETQTKKLNNVTSDLNNESHNCVDSIGGTPPGHKIFHETSLVEESTTKDPEEAETESNTNAAKGISRSEVLIGGDTEGSRSARESFRERHTVKTFSETKKVGTAEKSNVQEDAPSSSSHLSMEKPALRPTYSLKTVLEVDDMARCIDRISNVIEDPALNVGRSSKKLTGSERASDKCTSAEVDPGVESIETTLSLPEEGDGRLTDFKSLVHLPLFKSLIKIHNTIQLVQCFRCPPPALCTDVRDLVQECMMSLQGCPLSEAVEILDILNKIEFEALFYSHDKLADLQGGMPWNKCLAEMWQKEKHGTATPDSNTRVVRITKQNEPLGATVRNEGEKVVIGRVVKGGAAERSGNLHPGDEVLEVNGLRLKGKSVHDICATLCQMSGTLTFVIIPGTCPPQEEDDQPVYHYRAHFSYSPEDDLYIPCHELGISFQRGDILHVINKSDPHWWQAYRDGEWTQTLAGLIPSLDLQQHRMAMQKQSKEEVRERSVSPARKKSNPSLFCAKKAPKRRSTAPPLTKDFPPYEEMALYYPQPNQRRPLILVGPPSIGRHELRQQLLDQAEKFAAPVPHTTRPKEEGEINGIDYHFVNKSEFERLVDDGKFLEHGEYDKQMYGTTITSVRNIIASGKICVLNIQITSLPGFHESDLKPYVVFLTPASPHLSRHIKCKNGETFKEDEYRELVIIAHNMEDFFGHYFDSVIPFEDVDFVYKQVMYEMSLLEKEPQWVPAKWVH